MALPLSISQIQKEFPELIVTHCGDDTQIKRIYSVEECRPGDLVFVSSPDFVEAALTGKASGVVTTEELAKEFSQQDQLGVLVCSDVKLAHAFIKQKYADRRVSSEEWGSVHPTAVIHPTAQIGEGCLVSPHVVIGQNVTIGTHTKILSGVVIEEGAQVGNDCLIHPNVVVGYNCILKNSVNIGAGTVIGSEGYGFAQDKKGKSHSLPQTGNVIIEDNVRIGSNNSIDRATYASTRIGAGTKTDNLCHFAHNVQIGEDCLLTSMFCIAGTSQLGDRVIASGQSGVIDHINVCDDVVLLHRAGVSKDITEPGAYASLPHMPLKDYLKSMSVFRKLSELAKKVKNLEAERQ